MSLQIILQALHVLYCGPWPWQICAHVGNSLMLSGESGHNTAQSIPQNFFEQSGTEQRMWPGDTRPVRINDFYRVSHSRHHSSHHLWWEKTKSWQLRSKSILDICYGCSDQPQCIYLTPCVLATGETIYLVTDNTWGHGASLESGECQPHTSDCELISSDRDYVASKQWAPSYEAIGLTGDTLINTRLGK